MTFIFSIGPFPQQQFFSICSARASNASLELFKVFNNGFSNREENELKPDLRTAELDHPLASFSLFSKESGGGGSSGGATKSSVAIIFE